MDLQSELYESVEETIDALIVIHQAAGRDIREAHKRTSTDSTGFETFLRAMMPTRAEVARRARESDYQKLITSVNVAISTWMRVDRVVMKLKWARAVHDELFTQSFRDFEDQPICRKREDERQSRIRRLHAAQEEVSRATNNAAKRLAARLLVSLAYELLGSE